MSIPKPLPAAWLSPVGGAKAEVTHTEVAPMKGAVCSLQKQQECGKQGQEEELFSWRRQNNVAAESKSVVLNKIFH